MLAWEKDNTIAKNCQKICVLTTREQTLISNKSIRIQTHRLNSSRDKEHNGTQFLKIGVNHSPIIASIKTLQVFL